MDLLSSVVDSTLSAAHMDAVDALRAFFIFTSCAILSISLPDALRSRFISYGARVTSASTSDHSPTKATTSSLTRALDCIATLRVPHSYFIHFYVASVISSIFWAVQLLLRGPVFRFIAARISPEHLRQSMSIHQVMICSILMLIQGGRRLHECRIFSKSSSSQMWFVHWLAGLAFYLAVGVALWIEGSAKILAHEITLDDVKMTNAPSLRTFLSLPIFLVASGLQHDCHHFLFSLEKYTLPTHPLFSRIVCPHYTAECAIYLSLALLAAPEGEMVNKTLLSAVGFVVVNLGITAATTRQWYKEKFGDDAVRAKWNMLPGIY